MATRHGERKQTLITLFRQAAQAMVEELTERMAAVGYPDIRPVDSQVFENLDPGGSRLTDLAARARMTHQSMSELVAGLEQRGYVERVPDPNDRRARLVQLTPRGRQVMRVSLTEIARIEACWLRDLDPGLARALRAALQTPTSSRPTPDRDHGDANLRDW